MITRIKVGETYTYRRQWVQVTRHLNSGEFMPEEVVYRPIKKDGSLGNEVHVRAWVFKEGAAR